MNVIAKISCYLDSSVITLKLRKEYLNTATNNTPVLIGIKYWSVWHIEHYFMPTYIEVSNFQKQSVFWPTLHVWNFLIPDLEAKLFFPWNSADLWLIVHLGKLAADSSVA